MSLTRETEQAYINRIASVDETKAIEDVKQLCDEISVMPRAELIQLIRAIAPLIQRALDETTHNEETVVDSLKHPFL